MTRNRSNNKVPQVRPRCFFCDVEGVTNEHLWPLWMHPLLPEDLKDFHISYVTSTNFVDGEKVSEKEKREHRGAVRHTKIRRFCKRCAARENANLHAPMCRVSLFRRDGAMSTRRN